MNKRALIIKGFFEMMQYWMRGGKMEEWRKLHKQKQVLQDNRLPKGHRTLPPFVEYIQSWKEKKARLAVDQ